MRFLRWSFEIIGASVVVDVGMDQVQTGCCGAIEKDELLFCCRAANAVTQCHGVRVRLGVGVEGVVQHEGSFERHVADLLNDGQVELVDQLGNLIVDERLHGLLRSILMKIEGADSNSRAGRRKDDDEEEIRKWCHWMSARVPAERRSVPSLEAKATRCAFKTRLSTRIYPNIAY